MVAAASAAAAAAATVATVAAAATAVLTIFFFLPPPMLMHLIFTFVSIPVNFPLSNLPTSSTCEDGSLCFEERGGLDNGGYTADALADHAACFKFCSQLSCNGKQVGCLPHSVCIYYQLIF